MGDPLIFHHNHATYPILPGVTVTPIHPRLIPEDVFVPWDKPSQVCYVYSHQVVLKAG